MQINQNPINLFAEEQKADNKLLEKTKISIVIPMYNEEKSIKSVLDKIPHLPNYEVLVVDDGSRDSSRQIVGSYSDPHVKLIKHEINMGYGKTLLDGIMKSTGDIILTMDSDGQHEPRDIYNLVAPILKNEADMVCGSRYLGKYYYPIPFTSRSGEAILELIIKIFFKASVKNNQNGFRAYRETIKPVFMDIKNFDFDFAMETLMRACLKNLRIVEVPVRVYGRRFGSSRIRLVRLLMKLCKCILNFITLKYLGPVAHSKLSKLLEYIKF